MKAKELWLSREEYQIYSLKEFRDHIAQHKRYIIEPTGFVNKRNKEAAKAQEKEVADMQRAWEDALADKREEDDD
jgi:hypothetical protein